MTGDSIKIVVNKKALPEVQRFFSGLGLVGWLVFFFFGPSHHLLIKSLQHSLIVFVPLLSNTVWVEIEGSFFIILGVIFHVSLSNFHDFSSSV